MKWMTVWAKVATTALECNMGQRHVTTIWTSKKITDSGRTYVFNNGYERVVCKIYLDRQGREYQQQITVDFVGAVSYWRESDNMRFVSRIDSRPAYDVLGRLIR